MFESLRHEIIINHRYHHHPLKFGVMILLTHPIAIGRQKMGWKTWRFQQRCERINMWDFQHVGFRQENLL